MGRVASRWTGRAVLEIALVMAVLTTSLLVFRGASALAPYHGDESHYIWTSCYFDFLFVHPDLTRPEWGDGYATHTQPMLARYIVGASLWLRGVDPGGPALPADYDWSLTEAENVSLGNVPDAELLAIARAPMVAFAVGAVGLLYTLGRAVSGPLGGLAAATFALGSPLAREALVRATPDAPLIFFVLLALTLSVIGARRSDGGLAGRWALLVGVALGLAIGSKLAALVGAAALVAWGLQVALLAFYSARSSGWRVRLRQACQAGSGWLLAVLVAYHVFLLTDPHLYAGPAAHTIHLFAQLAAENRDVMRFFPDQVLRPVDRPRYVFEGSLGENTLTGSLGFAVEPFLAAIGAGALLVQTWYRWRRARRIRARGLIVLTTLVYYLGVTSAISMAWQRYLIPTLMLGNLLSGIGLAWFGRSLVAGALVALGPRLATVRLFWRGQASG